MRELLQAISEYPWTFAGLVFAAVVVIAVTGEAVRDARKRG